jgi:transposase
MEQWAQVRRMHFVDRISIKEIARRTGLARNTIRAAVRDHDPPHYERSGRPSKLDPFKDEIERISPELNQLGKTGGRYAVKYRSWDY